MAETTNAPTASVGAPGTQDVDRTFSVPTRTEVSATDLLITPHSLAWKCAAVGWRVFPIKHKTKTPAIKRWQIEATTDPDQIRYWWGTWFGEKAPMSKAQVGIATGAASGIWVLDIDVKWCNGRASARDLFKAHGETRIPSTFRAQSPSLGEQWFFRYPTDGRRIGNDKSSATRPGPLGPGLEWRGEGGQVVAPFTPDRPVLNYAAPIDAPAWLVELVTAKEEPAEYVTPEWHEDAGIALGYARRQADRLAEVSSGRNNELNRAAFQMGLVAASGALTHGTAWTLLREACGTNGLIVDDGEKSFEDTFASGWSKGVEAGGQA